MRAFIKYLLILVSLVTGATFLYSAWTKVLPIQPFEYTMVEYLHMPWLLATIAARFMVGLEAALGGLLVLHLFGKNKLVPKIAFLLLLVFSVYLVWLWATAGDDINCGCFGDAIWMSPSVSLIKNGILMVFTALIIRYHWGLNFKLNNATADVVMLCGIILPFILFPMSTGEPGWLKKGSYKIDLAPLYTPKRDDTTTVLAPYPAVPSFDLNKGKHIIAFVSPSCEHCRFAARKMALMRKADTTLPFFLVIGGIASDLTDFWKQTRAEEIPWMRLHRDPFLDFTGGVFPLIIWVKDGQVVAKSTYNSLTQSEIETWVREIPK